MSPATTTKQIEDTVAEINALIDDLYAAAAELAANIPAKGTE